jgi:hypothetical protein
LELGLLASHGVSPTPSQPQWITREPGNRSGSKARFSEPHARLKGPRARRNECHRRDLVGTTGKPFPPPVAIR